MTRIGNLYFNLRTTSDFSYKGSRTIAKHYNFIVLLNRNEAEVTKYLCLGNLLSVAGNLIQLMSYDIYCYKSKLGVPDEDEADRVVEANNGKWAKSESSPELKLAIVKALKSYNPRLEAFDFDYGEIANLTAATIQEAKHKFDRIELNPPEGDIAIQLTVSNNSVWIRVPYWYQGEQASQLFSDIKSYIKIIRETAGLRMGSTDGEGFRSC